MATPYKLSRTEREAGRRADFRVYYIRTVRGQPKAYFDAMWAPSVDEARRRFLAAAKEVGWDHVTITRILSVPVEG